MVFSARVEVDISGVLLAMLETVVLAACEEEEVRKAAVGSRAAALENW